MTPIKLLAFNNAPESLFAKGKERLARLFPEVVFDFDSTDPCLLVFLSGGSESEALRYARKKNFYILATFDENNSFAAATEAKAWFDQKGINNIMVDLDDGYECKLIEKYIKAKNALLRLNGQVLGVIGEPSEWLVASVMKAKTLKSKLGIHLQYIDWDEVIDYNSLQANEEFLKSFAKFNFPGIEDAGKVYSSFEEIIQHYGLSAISVECFSLVKKHSVTACLALSRFNDKGIPSGCEGDFTSIVGMMMIKEICGIIPWMANLIKVSAQSVKFAHCTAPTNLLESFKVDTHYETGLGTAVAGQFKDGDITVFRIDNRMRRAYLAEGTLISRPKSADACRTQIEVGLNERDAASLKQHPLGNHHLVWPGHHAEVMKTVLQILGMQQVNR